MNSLQKSKTLSASERMSAVLEELATRADQLSKHLAVRERVQDQYNATKIVIDGVVIDLAQEEKAQQVLLALEDAWRKDFERGIETAISEGIQLVFDKNLTFRIYTSVKAGASAVEFEIETPETSTNIMDAEGGSLVQVVSFLLRVLLILAHRPALRRILVLDEAFAGMDTENVPKLAMLLRKVVDESGVQVLMVTHDKTYIEYADAVYEVKKEKGVGKVKKVSQP